MSSSDSTRRSQDSNAPDRRMSERQIGFAEFLLKHHTPNVEGLAESGESPSLDFEAMDAPTCRRYIAAFAVDFVYPDLHLYLTLEQMRAVVKCHFSTLVIDPFLELSFLSYLENLNAYEGAREVEEEEEKTQRTETVVDVGEKKRRGRKKRRGEEASTETHAKALDEEEDEDMEEEKHKNSEEEEGEELIEGSSSSSIQSSDNITETSEPNSTK